MDTLFRSAGPSVVTFRAKVVRKGSTLPIIFVTAHFSEEARARALQGGAVESWPNRATPTSS